MGKKKKQKKNDNPPVENGHDYRGEERGARTPWPDDPNSPKAPDGISGIWT